MAQSAIARPAETGPTLAPAAPQPRAHRRLLGVGAGVLLLAGTALAQPAPAPPPSFAVEAAAAEIVAARAELARLEGALQEARLGLSAEIRLRPRLTLTWRDDPPRPLEAELAPRPDASVAWSPLRSEVLLAEARVVEARLDLADAMRDAAVEALVAPVELEAAVAERAAARADLQEARNEVATARTRRDEARAAAAAASPDAPELAEAQVEADRAHRAARLDLREAELDLADAERALAELTPVAPSLLPAPAAAPRRDLHHPAAPDPTRLAAYRARALRLAAEVARSERYRRRAFIPDVAMEVGYAGSDARVEGTLGMRAGRPRAEVAGSLDGTIQERGWARVTATLRFGRDGVRAATTPERLRAEAAATQEALASALRAEAHAAREEACARRARWRLAEDALRHARDGGDGRAIARAERDAVRTWLRFVRATHGLLEAVEAPVRIR
ncbi:MAG: hypothetical protein U5K81_00400 [Trueperaceae bacterium]|nr:hypothetical protein [Trueperaceae bacterium]